jgi:peroxiredoxin
MHIPAVSRRVRPALLPTVLSALLTVGIGSVCLKAHAETPDLGKKAPTFTLSTPEGKTVELAALEKRGEVVLVVLRGYPGYQCPYCQKQVHDFETHAQDFAGRGVQVLLVYPGPRGDLDAHAREFLAHEDALPPNFHLVIDPDYTFTNLYGLRWDAPHETAYPATFLIHRNGIIHYRKISHEHGDRTTAQEVLTELASHK